MTNELIPATSHIPTANRRPQTIYMNVAKRANSYISTRYFYGQPPLSAQSCNNDFLRRSFAQSTDLPQETSGDDEDPQSASETGGQGQARGRMSERLVQMTDDMIERDSRSAKKAIEEGGFSDELKKKLEARLQEGTFRSENAAAFAQASLPVRSYIYSYEDACLGLTYI